jgi:hypothetical protein
MKNARIYNYKDIDMMSAARTVVRNLEDNLDELSIIRAKWTKEYATALLKKIDSSMDNYLGLDRKKEQREATFQLLSLQAPVLRDISFFKTQVEIDMGVRASRIFKKLGFYTYLDGARQGDQQDLIQLLLRIRKEMDDKTKNAMLEKGASVVLLDRICDYADQIVQSNTWQEQLKDQTGVVSQLAVTIFNEVYAEVIGICKLASSYYRDEPVKKDMFTFTKVVGAMSVLNSQKRETEAIM